MLLLLPSWGAALPQPFGICGVISSLCHKQRAACLLPNSSGSAFPRLLPKAVTACGFLLSNGKAVRYAHKGKDTWQ